MMAEPSTVVPDARSEVVAVALPSVASPVSTADESVNAISSGSTLSASLSAKAGGLITSPTTKSVHNAAIEI